MSSEDVEYKAFLRRRRSIRRYTQEQITNAELSDLMEIASLAASAMNEQAWYFAVIQNEEIIQAMGELSGLDNPYYGAPTLIAAFARQDAIASVIDTTLAVSNMMNTAVADGLGTCFIYCTKDLFNDPRHAELRSTCGVPDGYECIGSIVVGHPAEEVEEPQDRNQDIYSIIR